MMQMTRLQSRIAALLMSGTVIVVLAWLIIFPLVGHYLVLGQSVEDKRSQVIRFRNLAANHDQLTSRLVQLKRRSSAKVFYVTGATPALASANMQQHLKQIIGSVGGERISTQLLPQSTKDTPLAAVLQVHLRADVSTLLQILYRLENGQPMFFLDDLTIKARPLRSAAQAAQPANILDVRFNLTGYLQEAL